MSNTSWSKELSIFIWFGLVIVTIGWLIGYWELAIISYLLAYVGWYFYNLHRMERWLSKGKKYAPPQASGVWGDMINEIHYWQQRARKRSKRLVRLLNRFRETTGAMPDGIIVLKETGGIEWWNQAAETLLSLKYPQDVGQRMPNLIRHPKFISYASGKTKTADITIDSPINDEIKLNIRIIPYGNNQSLVMIRNVTLVNQVEKMRRDFVGNISHELRTPLTVISGFIENLLDEDHESDPGLARALQLMEQQTRRMQQLTEDLMLLSRLENHDKEQKMQAVNVTNMLHSIKEQAMLISGERNHVILLEVDESLSLRGNVKELDSIFTNLIINAVNYTPDSGAIRVRWYRDNSGVHFEVHDTGIGISSHHIVRLTERFYRVDEGRSRATGGSGLGLAIVKHALQSHGGSLRIDSEVGRGSSFICDFPAELAIYKEATERQQLPDLHA